MSDSVDMAAMSGLQQLQEIVDGRVAIPIAETVGFRLVEAIEGRVSFEGVPSAAMLNPLGSIQGGWMAILLDAACGCAVHSMLTSSQAYTTLELKTAFHRALAPGTAVRVEGRSIQTGRRAAFSEADLRGTDGRLYASATSTCLVMDRV